MSDFEPTKPYVYQPFGMQDKAHWSTGRIYAISGLPSTTTIRGLTKDEATKVLAIITNSSPAMPEPLGAKEGEVWPSFGAPQYVFRDGSWRKI